MIYDLLVGWMDLRLEADFQNLISQLYYWLVICDWLMTYDAFLLLLNGLLSKLILTVAQR